MDLSHSHGYAHGTLNSTQSNFGNVFKEWRFGILWKFLSCTIYLCWLSRGELLVEPWLNRTLSGAFQCICHSGIVRLNQSFFLYLFIFQGSNIECDKLTFALKESCLESGEGQEVYTDCVMQEPGSGDMTWCIYDCVCQTSCTHGRVTFGKVGNPQTATVCNVVRNTV